MREFEGQIELIADCFDEAFALQAKWIEKFQSEDSKDKTNILYRQTWKKNNQLAKMP